MATVARKSCRNSQCEKQEDDDAEFCKLHDSTLDLPESPRGSCRLPVWKSWELPLGLLMRYAREGRGYRKRIHFCGRASMAFNSEAAKRYSRKLSRLVSMHFLKRSAAPALSLASSRLTPA